MTITLQESISANQSMILVDHPEETSLDDYLQIDDEIVTVRGKPSSRLIVGRGVLGTTRVSHVVGTTLISGSAPFVNGVENWASIGLAAKTLSVGTKTVTWSVGDLSILEQSDEDYSVVGSTIVSARGGRFQCGAFVGNPGGTLDGGSSRQRWLEFSARVMDGSGLGNMGLDVVIPIIQPDEGDFIPYAIAACHSSVIGFVQPGGACLASVRATVVNSFGTDTIPLDDFIVLYVWQV